MSACRVGPALLVALGAVACGDGAGADRAPGDGTVDGRPAGSPAPESAAVDPVTGGAAPVSVSADDFLGAEACQACHEARYDAWSASTHGRAGGPPTPAVVIAPFDGRPLRFADATVLPERDGAAYRFRVRRPGEPDQLLTVTGVVGGGHMVGGGTQGFLTSMPDGTVRFLPFDWSRDEGVWFCNTGSRAERGWVRIGPSLRLADCGDWPPSRVFGHTDRFSNCQECHGSQVTMGWDPEARRYASSYADLRINCESCHGAGRAHVEAARAGAAHPDSLAIRSLATLDTDASLDVCFQCHALKDVVRPGYLPGASLEAHYALKFPILGDEPYYPDGRVRTFAYQATHLYSDCYVNGSMTCTDCHDPHSDGYRDVWGEPLPGRFDDGQCLGCHAAKADAVAEHTRHPDGSPGSRCVACHMPYHQHPELGDDIRFARSDHVIAIPRPAFDDSLGIRSACAQCHSDRSAAELQEVTEAWWGPVKPHHPLVAGLLRARALAERGEADPATLGRLLLRPDLDHPIAQFAALAYLLEEHLRPGDRAVRALADPLARLAASPDLDVRALALATLDYAGDGGPAVDGGPSAGGRGAERGMEPAADALRRRRALALGYLADRDRDAGRLQDALAAYAKALALLPDDPRILAAQGAALRMAGRPGEAADALRRALRADPDLPLGRVNLAIALQEAGRVNDAAAVLQEALQASPYEPLVFFSMGNLLLRAGRPDEAERYYAHAVELDPGLARGWFYLARTRIEQRRYEDALPAARRALEFEPGNDGARQMVEDLERVLDEQRGG